VVGKLRWLVVVAGLVGTAGAADFPADLVNWTASPANPVFTGTGLERGWDRKIRERGYILVEDGVYHLWYTGYNDARSPNRSLGYAQSVDGISWIKYPSNPIVDTSWVEDVCVVKEGETYFMFAEGDQDIAHLLTSTDRVHWRGRGPLDIRLKSGEPIPPGPRGTPAVFVKGGVWHLFYERGDRGVWLATTRDPVAGPWTNVQDEPVVAMGPGAYDQFAVAFDQVFERDGVFYAYYHANAHNPWKADWTTNLARSSDLIHWEKYPHNPLIAKNSSSSVLVVPPGSKRPRLYTMHPEVRVFESAAQPVSP